MCTLFFRFRTVSVIVGCCTAILLACASLAANDTTSLAPRRILILSSFQFSDPWSQEVIRSLSTRIRTQAPGSSIHYLELNAENPACTPEVCFTPALAGIQRGDYDAVVALHNDAGSLLLLHASRIPRNLPILLYANSGIIRSLLENHLNVSGISGKIELRNTVDFGLSVLPAAREVLVITEPSRSLEQLHNEFDSWEKQRDANGSPFCKLVFVNSAQHSLDELVELTSRLPESAFVVFGLHRDTVRDKLPSLSALGNAFCSRSARPVFGVSSSLLDHGILGASVSDAAANGELLADLLTEALRSGDAAGIVPRTESTRFVLDLKTAHRLALDPLIVPPGTELVNRPVKFFHTHKFELILLSAAILAVCLFVILALVFYIRYFRLLRKNIAVFGALPANIGILDRDGNFLFKQTDTAAFPDSPQWRRLDDIPGLEDLPRFHEQLDLLFTKKIPFSFRHNFRGRRRHVTCSLVSGDLYGREAAVCITQDTTELESLRQEQEQSRQLLELIVNNFTSAVSVKDAGNDFRYLFCNQPFLDILGVSNNELIGKNVAELSFHVFNPDEVQEQDSRITRTGNPFKQVKSVTDPRGMKAVFQITKIPCRRAGASTLIIEIIQDITRSHNLENQQDILINELNNHIENEQIINFCLQNISLENNFGKAVRDMLRVIGHASLADHCLIFHFPGDSRQAGSLYEWSASNSAPFGLEYAYSIFQNQDFWAMRLKEHNDLCITDIDTLSGDMLGLVPCFRAKGIRAFALTGIWIEQRLCAVAAVDYFDPRTSLNDNDVFPLHGAVKLYILAYQRHRKMAELESSAHFRKLIFEQLDLPVVLFDTSRKIVDANSSFSRIFGSGMIGRPCHDAICSFKDSSGCKNPQCPLSIVLESGSRFNCIVHKDNQSWILKAQPIVDSAGMLINVLQSFYPLADSSDASIPDGLPKFVADSPDHIRSAAQLKRVCRFLLVDDVSMNLNILEIMLKKLDQTDISVAASASRALELLEQKNFDIILTDLWMPDVNGAQMVSRLRHIPGQNHCKVYAVTSDHEARVDFNLSEFAGVLHKPIPFQRLKQIISSWEQEQRDNSL